MSVPPTTPTMAGKPMPTSTLPRFRWPSERHQTPTHCDHCGARLLLADPPTSEHPIADQTCLTCSRAACELVLDGLRAPMTPVEFRALPTQQGQRRGRPPGSEREARP